jgi:hypothetical protein
MKSGSSSGGGSAELESKEAGAGAAIAAAAAGKRLRAEITFYDGLLFVNAMQSTALYTHTI